ncbi:MAG TPA: hypothetical protein VNJ02_12470 [Vicinamibacterales bacterium]|nr:hypothetical protein [Vicinamibacterales bacterium]
MKWPTIGEINEVQAAESKDRRIGRLAELGDATAQHPALPHVFAILVIDVVRRIGNRRRTPRATPAVSIQQPSIEPSRTPTDAVQRVVVGVVHDGADVIVDREDFRGGHRVGVDAIDDRAAVRSILRDGYPDGGAIKVDPARVIHRALAEPEIGQQLAGPVKLEQMADAVADRSVVTVNRRVVSRGARTYFDRGHEEGVADFHQPLRMMGRERDRNGAGARPLRLSRERHHALGHCQSIGARALRGHGTASDQRIQDLTLEHQAVPRYAKTRRLR